MTLTKISKKRLLKSKSGGKYELGYLILQKMTRMRISVRVRRGLRKGEARKNCLDDERVNGDGALEQPIHTKIRYSIKFAHEKEKISPSEDDNIYIIMKIHREEKKYKHEDDDDSSGEHAHPQRLRFVDDDEE